MSAAPIPVPTRPAHLALLTGLWQQAQFTDRLYVVYFVGLGALIWLQRHRVDGWPLLLALHVGVLALIGALVAGAGAGPRGLPAAQAWYPLLMPLVTFPEIAGLNLMLVDGWRDAPLLAFEAWLFPEPPLLWLRRVTPAALAELFQAGYLSYFLFLIVVAAALRRRSAEAGFRGVIAASVLAYLACYVVFVACPMEGPAHTMRHLSVPPAAGGPFYDLVRLVQRAGVHGNAFPSAHVAGAVPPLIFAWRYAPRLGACLTPLIVLMGLGAVYDGYHYVSDVLAGLVVGGAAAAVVLAAQQSPAWARRLRLPEDARSSARSGTGA
jgi:membrane-associated phospholipid phosphatase